MNGTELFSYCAIGVGVTILMPFVVAVALPAVWALICLFWEGWGRCVDLVKAIARWVFGKRK